ncbi:hypothetical protein EDB80DRAFT_833114 [Ilyonectria destructans]|nr:hypothetical protein EDB80DRAFT_833114 [Ilyonectria destructans]
MTTWLRHKDLLSKLVALRYNDVRDDTDFSRDIIENYMNAWKEKGMLQEDGLLIYFYYPRQDRKTLSRDVGSTAWSCVYMNPCNPSLASETYKKFSIGFLEKPNGDHIIVCDKRVACQIRELVETEGVDGMDPSTYQRASQIATSKEWPSEFTMPFISPVFGYAMQARIAKSGENQGLPDVDVITGNAGIAYGRLNMIDGQRKMYLNTWTSDHFSNSPFVEKSTSIDFLRGSWNEELHALAVTMRTWYGATRRASPPFSGFKEGDYAIYKKGSIVETWSVSSRSESFTLDLEVSGNGLDIVVLRGH